MNVKIELYISYGYVWLWSLFSSATLQNCFYLQAVVSEVPGIQQCFVTCEDEAKGVWKLKTDGTNLSVC